MAGITIIPGTFNPPATPLVSHGAYAWPKTPKGAALPRPMQFTSRIWEPPVETGTTLPVIYISHEFTTGEIVLGVETDAFDSSPADITTAGVRYLADGSYTKTGHDGLENQYFLTATPLLTADMIGIDFGSVEVKDSGGVSYVRLLFGFALTIEGAGDSAVYETAVSSDGGAVTTETGTCELWFAPGTVDQFVPIYLSLLRNGVAFDRVRMVIRVTGTVTSSPTGPDDPPTAGSGLTLTDTLYGAQSSPGVVDAPTGLPLAAYLRESWNVQGTANYS